MSTIIICIVLGLAGLFVGSLINNIVGALLRDESISKGSVLCPKCSEKLSHPIPVISWFKGSCKCGEKISPIYIITELATSICFILSYALFPWETNGLYSLTMILMLCGLIVLARQDAASQEMSISVLIYTGIIAVISIILSYIPLGEGHLLTSPADLKAKIIGAFSVSLIILIFGFVFTPIAYVLFLSQDHKDKRRLNRAIKNASDEREKEKLRKKLEKVEADIKETGPVFGFGMGDVVVMFTGGLMFGWKTAATAGIIAIFTGAAYGIINNIISDDEDESNAFAFGPFLIVGLLIGAFCGENIVDAYLASLYIG